MADITYPYLPAVGNTLTAAGLNGNLYSTTPATSIHETANGLLEALNFDPAFKIQGYQVRPGQTGQSISFGRTPRNDFFSDLCTGAGTGYVPVAGCCVTFFAEYPVTMAMFTASCFVSAWRQFGADGGVWPTRLAAPEISVRTFFAGANGGITTHVHSQRDMPQSVFLSDTAVANHGNISMVEQRLTRHFNLSHPKMQGGTSPCDPILAGEHTFGLAVLVKTNLSGQDTTNADEAWDLRLNGVAAPDARPVTNYAAVPRISFYARSVTATRLL